MHTPSGEESGAERAAALWAMAASVHQGWVARAGMSPLAMVRYHLAHPAGAPPEECYVLFSEDPDIWEAVLPYTQAALDAQATRLAQADPKSKQDTWRTTFLWVQAQTWETIVAGVYLDPSHPLATQEYHQ